MTVKNLIDFIEQRRQQYTEEDTSVLGEFDETTVYVWTSSGASHCDVFIDVDGSFIILPTDK